MREDPQEGTAQLGIPVASASGAYYWQKQAMQMTWSQLSGCHEASDDGNT
jgi:hypothetical protein